jgi:DNA-binding beta-propeller fold protein YncE
MKFKLHESIWAFALVFILFACEDSTSDKPLGAYETGILIMNEGAFGSNDGEVYHLEPASGFLKPNIFEMENNRPFAGLLEDMVMEGERLFLVANTGKVEIVNSGDFKSRGAVAGGLDQPRSLAINGNKLFISDYGPYDASYNTPDSYIAVVNGLDGGAVGKKIQVTNKPEDLFTVGKFVLVAGSEEKSLQVIDAESETLTKTLVIAGSPTQFFILGTQLWLFAPALEKVYFHRINTSSFDLTETVEIAIPDATGKMAIGNNGRIYLLTSTGWPDYQDAVASVSIPNSQPIVKELIKGSGFYGIGFDQNRGELYLTNAKGFQGNGNVTVYNESGTVLKTLDMGRGPSGFMMR